MANMLIIDWDDHQARLLDASVSGGVVRVGQAEAEPIGDEASTNAITDAMRKLLARHSGSKSHVVLTAGGRNVQSRLLLVPPVPADELPDLIRLRANTEFPAADESSVIDFLPIAGGDSQPIQAFVARVGERTLSRALTICEQSQVTPHHVAMRGGGIASLALAAGSMLATGTHLVAARRGDELDLVCMQHGKPAVVRSVPLASDHDEAAVAQAAAREIKRTIAAVGSELNISDIDSLQWIVGDEADGRIARQCGDVLARRAEPIDMASVTGGNAELPAGAASFAGMLGIAMSAANHQLPIDFLNPRKPPENRPPITTYALAGTLAAIVLLGGGWFLYNRVASLERATQIAIDERTEVERDVEQLQPEYKQALEVEQWQATNVDWLDELDRIAVTLRPERLDDHEAFEPDRDVRLTSLLAKQSPGRKAVGGTVELAGQVRSSGVVEELENQLRGPGRQVNPKPLVNNPGDAPYEWTFQDEIVVTPTAEERQ